jgi:hypothetical protein
VKSDQELISSLAAYLRSAPNRRTAALELPIAGFQDADELHRVVELARAKCFVENIVRTDSARGPRWIFDLTTRGSEAMGLD